MNDIKKQITECREKLQALEAQLGAQPSTKPYFKWDGNPPCIYQFNDATESIGHMPGMPTTDAEVRAYLLADATKRGFVLGAKVRTKGNQELTIHWLKVVEGKDRRYRVLVASDVYYDIDNLTIIPQAPRFHRGDYVTSLVGTELLSRGKVYRFSHETGCCFYLKDIDGIIPFPIRSTIRASTTDEIESYWKARGFVNGVTVNKKGLAHETYIFDALSLCPNRVRAQVQDNEGHLWLFEIEDLEITPAKPTHQYKVGDYVRAVADMDGYGCIRELSKGHIYRVLITQSNNTLQVKPYPASYHTSYFEPLPPIEGLGAVYKLSQTDISFGHSTYSLAYLRELLSCFATFGCDSVNIQGCTIRKNHIDQMIDYITHFKP